ncbi:hypothetical protein [Aneurinibacillus migulanus]|nr:hypothetical protein [Aneurinibacillus migulanus]
MEKAERDYKPVKIENQPAPYAGWLEGGKSTHNPFGTMNVTIKAE